MLCPGVNLTQTKNMDKVQHLKTFLSWPLQRNSSCGCLYFPIVHIISWQLQNLFPSQTHFDRFVICSPRRQALESENLAVWREREEKKQQNWEIGQINVKQAAKDGYYSCRGPWRILCVFCVYFTACVSCKAACLYQVLYRLSSRHEVDCYILIGR